MYSKCFELYSTVQNVRNNLVNQVRASHTVLSAEGMKLRKTQYDQRDTQLGALSQTVSHFRSVWGLAYRICLVREKAREARQFMENLAL